MRKSAGMSDGRRECGGIVAHEGGRLRERVRRGVRLCSEREGENCTYVLFNNADTCEATPYSEVYSMYW